MAPLFVVLLLAAAVESLSFEAHVAFTGVQYEVSISLTNTESTPITVFSWGSPFQKSPGMLSYDSFDIVSTTGVVAPFIGITVKRRLTAEAFQTLQPNQTVSVKAKLLKGYWFPEPGTYVITLNSKIQIFGGTSSNLNQFTSHPLISSGPLSLQVNQSFPKPDVLIPLIQNDTVHGKITEIIDCDAGLHDVIYAADTIARKEALQARDYLHKVPCAKNPSYLKWFGVCDSARYSEVTDNFDAIYNRIILGYKVKCELASQETCFERNALAYVTSASPNIVVHVCPTYFGEPSGACAIDSKGGTIIHELSHFDVIAMTRDHAYGTQKCQTLADTNPATAILNADSHEYYSETCPSVATFATWNTLTKGRLPVDETAGETVGHVVTITCLKNGAACPVFEKIASADLGALADFSRDLAVQWRQVTSTSRVTLQLLNTAGDGPSTLPLVPLYLYFRKAPPGTYTFTQVPILAAGQAYLVGNVLTVPKGPGKAFSGVLQFPVGTTQIYWAGVASTPEVTRLTFTLAWVTDTSV